MGCVENWQASQRLPQPRQDHRREAEEALLLQLEYQAALAEARGQRGIDVAWLRAQLGRVR